MTSYWDTQLFAPDALVASQNPELLGGSIFSTVWTRAHATLAVLDQAIWSVHLSMRPGVAHVYDQLNAADAAAVESSFSSNWFATMQSHITSGWTLAEFRWRNFGADYPLDKNGFSRPGPIWRLTPYGSPGTGQSGRLPDQDAATVSYRTTSRKHWGRNYVGGIPTTELATPAFGQLSTAYVDALAGAFHSWFNNLWGLPRQIDAIVWSAKYRGILGVDQLVVDDVVDIVRRRRANTATYRKIFSS